MRLVRFGPQNHEKPGVIDIDGHIRDLSSVVDDLTPEWFTEERLQFLRDIDPQQLPVVENGVRLGVPFAMPRQFIAIGLNYRQHAIEAGLSIPKEPVVFTKSTSCIAGPNDDVTIPTGATKVDWEVELGVIIGRPAYNVSIESALDFVAGYCLANDISEREWQFQHDTQWFNGKSFAGFGPLGPWFVSRDEIIDPQALDMELWVNGKIKQRANTSDMIFSVREIVAYLSGITPLRPGDIIITGTPEGVGMGMRPPQYLQRGDIVHLQIKGLGTQTQRFI